MTTRRRFLGSAAALGGLAAAGIPGVLFAQDGKGTAPPPPAPGEHALPPLPYPYEALEPHIDAETLRLHHDKHHAGYVKGLNAAEVALVEAREKGDFASIGAIEQRLAFHGSGHLNHVLFWSNMGPENSVPKQPDGEITKALARDFGGFDAFRAQFQEAAATVEGNGWAALVYHPHFRRLYVSAVLNHQNHVLNGSIPLLVCDVWEHAYYLKYQNRRGDFVGAWWNLVDWSDVGKRFGAARSIEP
ncbi:MAG: superoxide dismutase [Candidatus Eisenbacteria bacterium]